MKGYVKWFKNGYGFISGDDHKDYFCHYSSILGEGFKELSNDERVSFDIKETDKGDSAINIEKQE